MLRTPLGRTARRAVLVVHVVAAGAWIGIDVVVAVLVGAGALADDVATRGLAYQALGTFAVVPMLTAGLATLASGLALGLGTKWGLVRYRWVLVKLVITAVLCVLVAFVLGPRMDDVAAHGASLLAGTGGTGTRTVDLVFPPLVSLTALSLAVTLSVFKPWGRVRRRRDRPVATG